MHAPSGMTRVAEIMNRELFHFRPADSLRNAPGYLVSFGITAAPVLDDDGRPVGVLSLRDCLGELPPIMTVADRMTRPAVTVPVDATVDATAHLLAETRLHRLVVVDGFGKAVGMVSAVDLIRAMVGMPPRHPAQFPHLEQATGLTWTDDMPLEMERIEAAPDGPGVFLLIDPRGGGARVVWGEWTHELRTRLVDLLSLPQSEAALRRILDQGPLWFRAAALPDGPARMKTVEAVIARHIGREAFVSR